MNSPLSGGVTLSQMKLATSEGVCEEHRAPQRTSVKTRNAAYKSIYNHNKL